MASTSRSNPLGITRDVCDFVKITNELKANAQDPDHTHLDLARSFRSRETSDERDKIFALGGLLKSSDFMLVGPHHSERTNIKFARFTRACINRHKNLGILAISEQMCEALDLSWVANWLTIQSTRYRVPMWIGGIMLGCLDLEPYQALGRRSVKVKEMSHIQDLSSLWALILAVSLAWE